MSAERSGRPDKLVILCIHGFRQNAKQFKGRLAGLQKKLAHVATFIFIDAPYVLPLWYKPHAGQPQQPQQQQQQQQQQTPDARCMHGSNSKHSVDYTGYCRHERQLSPARPHHTTWQHHGPPDVLPHPKRAWLLSRKLLEAQPHLQRLYSQQSLQQPMPPSQPQADHGTLHQESINCAHDEMQQMPQQHDTSIIEQEAAINCQFWQPAPEDVTISDQHTTQCCGWERSWKVIQDVLESGQHIDGILGFSQGAAVAAVVAALQQQQRQNEASWQGNAMMELSPTQNTIDQHGLAPTVQPQYPAPSTSVARGTPNYPPHRSHATRAGLKFVILGSGFVSPAEEHQLMLRQTSPIMIPSLHLYASGKGSSDRQIQQQLSEDLMQLFDPATRQLVVHSSGHLIPCNRNVVDQFEEFLNNFTR